MHKEMPKAMRNIMNAGSRAAAFTLLLDGVLVEALPLRSISDTKCPQATEFYSGNAGYVSKPQGYDSDGRHRDKG